MTFSLSHLALLVLGYLCLLFFAAYSVERKWVPQSWLSHPLVYVLSLGVYASAWAFYGSVALAQEYGYGFLAYYLGISGAFSIAPFMLRPILRTTRRYQLSSLADLLAFRYRSRWAGTLVTLVMLAVVVPILSLQITAIGDTLHLLNGEWPVTKLALAFCIAMMAFAILFGARHASAKEKNDGLVFAIAMESVIKLTAMLILGGFVIFYVFPQAGGLETWLEEQQTLLSSKYETFQDGPWRTLLLMFFSAAVAMPHMFHMIFTENNNPNALKQASWGLPLFLIAMSICVPPILWAAIYLGVDTEPSYYALGIGLQSESVFLTLTTFFGGLAAASGITIVTTLAMSSMLMNHLILPYHKPGPRFDFYRWILWGKRLLIGAIILAAYGFYHFIGTALDLKYIGFLAFVAAIQFMPGVLGLLYWPQSNRVGFLVGLIAGTLAWVFSLLLPFYEIALGISLPFYTPAVDETNWHLAAVSSFSINTFLFVGLSLALKQSPSEIAASDACSVDSVSRPSRQPLLASNSNEIIQALSPSLGRQAAEREVLQALQELNLPSYEDRPYALRRLRIQLEANLSGLVGPTAAYDILNRYLPFREDVDLGEDIHQIEQGLEGSRTQLSGLASELDNLRRYHRQTLQDLPIGVCSLTNDGEVLMWNHALEALSGIRAEDCIGANIDHLPEPWKSLIGGFFNSSDMHLNKHKINIQPHPRWFTLNKAMVAHNSAQYDGTVILVDEQTETQRLEDELIHSERLASIGRLAAGVAHEIGNPITGIDCLAQNIRYETQDPELLEMADQIQEQTKRVTRIVQSLMNFSHAGNHKTEFEPVDIHTCIEDAIHLLTLSKESDLIRFINQCQEQIRVYGDGQRLVQVFVNLLGNAQDASENGGDILIKTQVNKTQLSIQIIDQGHGIPQELQDSIFDPFFTTKEVGKGTGLGLPLAYSIIEQHYGNISVKSPYHNGQGTCVNIDLPLYSQVTETPE